MEKTLPPIPVKRYFTIGEVGELCGVKPHVLRYWEQEFTQLRPMKRRGNRRYYQHHEVLMIRRIRDLLYDQGFTISGARNKLQELAHADRGRDRFPSDDVFMPGNEPGDEPQGVTDHAQTEQGDPATSTPVSGSASSLGIPATLQFDIRKELLEIRELLRYPV